MCMMDRFVGGIKPKCRPEGEMRSCTGDVAENMGEAVAELLGI